MCTVIRMFIEPMLLHASDPFSAPDWIFEPKMDGVRIILCQTKNEVKIYTRHHTEVTSRYPELTNLPFNEDIVLDGEIICYDPDTGKVDFVRCMERFLTKRPEKMKRLAINYVVFDMLSFNGIFATYHYMKERIDYTLSWRTRTSLRKFVISKNRVRIFLKLPSKLISRVSWRNAVIVSMFPEGQTTG